MRFRSPSVFLRLFETCLHILPAGRGHPSPADHYKRKRALGKKANTAILSTARRMARIAWQLLTEKRAFETLPPAQKTKGRTGGETDSSPVSVNGQEAMAISAPLSPAAPL
jgi:hypothetical protein